MTHIYDAPAPPFRLSTNLTLGRITGTYTKKSKRQVTGKSKNGEKIEVQHLGSDKLSGLKNNFRQQIIQTILCVYRVRVSH